MSLQELPPEIHPASDNSLSDIYSSVKLGDRRGWRRALVFAGPAFLVSVGYMDPGNWATDLAGGSQFGYALLWVVLASSVMAIILQTLCARMGVAMDCDLATACRRYYPAPVTWVLWVLCEIAIVSCDIAEVIGSAIALQLLFAIPLTLGVLITGLDVLVLLGLTHLGFRKLEAMVVALISTIVVCFGINVFWSKPDWSQVGSGLTHVQIPGQEALVIAVGILGATVMPHNLYLHTSLVQSRQYKRTPEGRKEAIKLGSWETWVALGAAFFVNAAILVLAAATFHAGGIRVEELADAHKFLTPLLGSLAATLFAVALLCAGQSSTITATLAGQIVMEGFLRIKVAPWIRRLVTRGLAIVPALIMVTTAGEHHTTDLLIDTQVILAMQLPFAVFPLIAFTANRKLMGNLAAPLALTGLGILVGLLITALNLQYLVGQFGWLKVSIGLAVTAGFGVYWWLHRHEAVAEV